MTQASGAPLREDEHKNPALDVQPSVGIDASLNYVRFPLKTLTRGLAIVGQSGCGKSFLLGRLLEEIIRTTESSRILILDCNSDFYFGLDPKLPDDFGRCRDRCLQTLQMDDSSGIRGYEDAAYAHVQAHARKWRSHVFYTPGVVAAVEDSLPMESQLAPLSLALNWHWVTANCWRYLEIVKGGAYSHGYLRQVASYLSDRQEGDAVASIETTATRVLEAAEQEQSDLRRQVLEELHIDLLREEALGVWDDVSPPTLIENSHVPSIKWLFPASRIAVLQLESLGGPHIEAVAALTVLRQLLAAHQHILDEARLAELGGGEAARDATLRSYIERGEFARTFLVVDEVQRYAPEKTSSPQLSTLASLLVQIAGEARKFGIHLILATQRPSKVRPGLLGECSSAVVMKMNSRSDLVQLADQMRILDVKLLEHSLHFQGFGNAIAAGEITQRPPSTVLFRAAPRRSKEGGVDLKMY